MFNRKGKFDAPASFKTGGKFHAPDGLNRIFALLALFVVIAGGSIAYKFKEVKAKEAAGFLTTIVDATTTNKLIVNSDGSINTTPASGGSSAVTSIDGGIVTLGANADAAVGDATGTANSHLRQIAKLLNATLTIGGAVTTVDGGNVALGTTTDAAVGDATGTANAHLRQIAKTIVAGVPVTGTFWQATQPVSGTVTASNTAGDVASGSSDSGNPVKMGAVAQNVEATAVTNGQRANLHTDLAGKLIVMPFANPENFLSGATSDITDTTSTSLIASQGGSFRCYLTSIEIQNSHATVSTWVKVLDGSTKKAQIYCAAAGGGATIYFNPPLVGTAATAWNIQPETTGANVRGSASGYKGLDFGVWFSAALLLGWFGRIVRKRSKYRVVLG